MKRGYKKEVNKLSEDELKKLKELADRDEAIEKMKAQASLKTLKQFLEERDQVIEVYVPFPVDAKFRVKRPLMRECLQISDKEGRDYDRALLYLILRGGDESVTEEMASKLSDEEVTIFLGAINFLSQKKPSGAAQPSNVST